MTNITVIGAQWGDEGKGKIVDMLAEKANMVVRFQGGHNAGHTVIVQDKVFKISMLPSGVVRPEIINVIGNGVVLSPEKLFSELSELRNNGVEVREGHLIIADNAPILLPIHALVDGVLENKDGENKIGTTKRGISQAYQDKVGRRAIRVVDLNNPEVLKNKVRSILNHWNPILESHGAKPYEEEALLEEIESYRQDLLALSRPDVPEMIEQAIRRKANILFEGAQGTLLDVDHGTYPYVTSSNTVSSNVGNGTGLGPKAAGHVLGILKAYSTRVGLGPFPSVMDTKDAEYVGTIGKEFGTVTGRSRGCGWLDLVAMKKAVRLNGIDSLALTKIDVLDQMPEIRVVTGYKLDGKKIDFFPSSAEDLSRVEPEYRSFEGWQSDTSRARKFSNLPANAKAYIKFVQDYLGVPINIISVGPEREAIIERKRLFGAKPLIVDGQDNINPHIWFPDGPI
ncbi:MAG: adenylosuccinate synthase [Alphaproteobacteria bacterium]|nr:adenylosuccinate synthase [Alphaproteobacteria bacterium]